MATTPPRSRFRWAHLSLQASDTVEQLEADLEKCFDRFVRKGTRVITGTEAGSKSFRRVLRRVARKHGYKVKVARDCWVAVEKDFRKRGSWRSGYKHVLDSGASRTTKRHSDRGITWVSFDTKEFGRIAVGAAHYLTKGRPVAGKYGTNVDLNEDLAEAIGEWGKEHGRGEGLAFIGADANIIDKLHDVFFGEPFTTAWDEVRTWEDTGHGNIDVWASFDWDGRVEAVWVNALNDKEFFLFGDHFLVEGAYWIEHLEAV
jgi:hypothetical protein